MEHSPPPPCRRLFRVQSGKTAHVGTLKLLKRPRGSVSNAPCDCLRVFAGGFAFLTAHSYLEPTTIAIGTTPPPTDHYVLVRSGASFFNGLFVLGTHHDTTIAKRLLIVIIPFLTARAIKIMPSLIDHHLRVPSGASVSNGPILLGTHHESVYVMISFQTTRAIGIQPHQ